jgi:hypothetical protein
VGLSCIYGCGTWDNLAYYDRPAVLEFMMEDGQRYNVVVSALGDDQVTLDLNGRRFNCSPRKLDRFWTGAYIVINKDGIIVDYGHGLVRLLRER